MPQISFKKRTEENSFPYGDTVHWVDLYEGSNLIYTTVSVTSMEKAVEKMGERLETALNTFNEHIRKK